MRILHAIHDFLPRHRAGSEIYALELCRALVRTHHVTVLCADFDPSRQHGDVTWRVHQDLPVVEIVNNWHCATFEDTYRSPLMGDRIAHVLHAVQPDVVHVHNLLNLSFDLPAMARALGIPVVATLHDYTLVCGAGGQRIHRADAHVCHEIDTGRCARCVQESPLHDQASFGRLSGMFQPPQAVRAAGLAVFRRFPGVARGFVSVARRASIVPVTPHDIDARLAAARTVFDAIDLFIAPSRSIAAEFQRLGIEASKIRVSDYGFAPTGVAQGFSPGTDVVQGFSPAVDSGQSLHQAGLKPCATSRTTTSGTTTSGSPLVIGYVGTLVWHKGSHVLLEAVRNLPRGAYEVRIFGDPAVFPDYSAELRRLADGLPVRFMGAFDRASTADVYAQLDVLVVPSLWLENSPLVIHEAFMAGVPIIGARIGGIADLIEDGRTGWLYEPTSSADLESRLRQLIQNPDALGVRAGHAPPRVKSIDEDAQEWASAYADVVAGRVGVGHVA